MRGKSNFKLAADVITLPAIIHRWFPNDGEGWAYHPDLRERMSEFLTAVDPFLNYAPNRRRIHIKVNGGILVGCIYPDEHCEYEPSRDRNPFILCVFYVDDVISVKQPEVLNIAYQSSASIEIPSESGEAQSASVRLRAIPLRESNAGKSSDVQFNGWEEWVNCDLAKLQNARQSTQSRLGSASNHRHNELMLNQLEYCMVFIANLIIVALLMLGQSEPKPVIATLIAFGVSAFSIWRICNFNRRNSRSIDE